MRCDSAELAEEFAEASEHIFCAGQWHPDLDYKDALFGTAADFAKSFKAKFNMLPSEYMHKMRKGNSMN